MKPEDSLLCSEESTTGT